MNVFITGGSRGLGRAMALEFAQAGHNVAFTYVQHAASAEAVLAEMRKARPDGKFHAYQLDVKDSAAVDRVIEQAWDELGQIHGVVNNAGVTRNNIAALMTDEEWREVLDTNLSGPFFVCRAFLNLAIGKKYGRIVNISSIGADGTTGQINYSAAKSGLTGMSRSIAKEYGPKGITCNIVIPGVIPTDMTDAVLSKDFEQFWLKFCPARRMGTTAEMAALVMFLTSEKAGFINGESISLTGGLNYSP